MDNYQLTELKNAIIDGHQIKREQALSLIDADLDQLTAAADQIRQKLCGDHFDMCAVMSVRGGRCSEDCHFCSQSCISQAQVPQFDVRDTDFVPADAQAHDGLGIDHYCQVSSGRRLSTAGIDQVCANVQVITEHTGLTPCVSLGLLTPDDLNKLKAAGVRRVHNNLETSRRYFPQVCSSHTYDEKLTVIDNIHAAGLELCSGGVFGIGETWVDRIDMALTLRQFNPESVPINILNPVKGTPLGDQTPLSESEVRRIIAIYRFILPHSYIRLAAGRDYLPDTGLTCFKGGCNASITGDMVAVKGVSIETDLKNVAALGYQL